MKFPKGKRTLVTQIMWIRVESRNKTLFTSDYVIKILCFRVPWKSGQTREQQHSDREKTSVNCFTAKRWILARQLWSSEEIINVPPSLFFSPSLSYQQDVTFQLASFSLACFYRVIWFPWRFDLVFLLALYKGKGLTTKLTK